MIAENTIQEIKFDEFEEFEMKDEMVFIKEEICPGSTVEDTCTVYVQGDSIKKEITDTNGKNKIDLIDVKQNLFFHK